MACLPSLTPHFSHCPTPHASHNSFLADVLGLCEAQMRLLEANAAQAQDEEALKKEGNVVIRDMLAARKKFDLGRYFASLCTNQVRAWVPPSPVPLPTTPHPGSPTQTSSSPPSP